MFPCFRLSNNTVWETKEMKSWELEISLVLYFKCKDWLNLEVMMPKIHLIPKDITVLVD